MRSRRPASRPVHWAWASMNILPRNGFSAYLAAIMGAVGGAREGQPSMIEPLDGRAAELGARLKDRKESVAVAESSSGGLISAALLGVPGASAYYLGGAVVYSGKARMALMDLPRE